MSPRSPRNRVTTPTSPPFSLSLFDHDAKSRCENVTGGFRHAYSPPSLLYPQRSTGRFFISAFDQEPVSPPLPSFLPSFLANFSSPNSRVHSVETYVEMKFRSNFSPLLCVSGKEINKKEDKADGWFDRPRTGSQPRSRRTIARGEPRLRCGKEEEGRRFLGCTTITAVSYTHVPT